MEKWISGLENVISMKYKGMQCCHGDCIVTAFFSCPSFLVSPFISLSSVNQLTEVLRCHIEEESKLLYELTLPGVHFKINHVRILLTI